MIDLGTVRPGSTIRIPFSSFDKDDGSSITMTSYAVTDILVYKDGGTTERASTSGFTATTDFDAKTGKQLAVIDLADDTTADFFKAGSEYLVAIDAVTVDAVTTGGWIARFRIGYPGAYLDTSIATLASQTSFTLAAGPAEDDALNGMVLLIHDKASAVQVTRVVVEDYVGASKTVTLRAAPATTFTIAAGDNVSAVGFDKVDLTHAGGVAASAWTATRGLAGTALPAAAADAAGGIPISDAGALDIDTLLGKLGTGGFTAATFNADTDSYAAKSWLQRKSTATATDLYTAVWVKNGVDLSAGITVPKIQVIKRSDGTDLIAETAMTEIGATGMYKYDATGAELMTAGASYVVVFTATIGGSTRTSKWVQGRDV